MTSLTLSFFGPPEQKHVVKVTPMQTLKDVLHSASSKFRPALVAEQCELQLNKKAVDVNTPFRLLNIPAGSKLEILKRTSCPAPAAGAPAAAAATATSISTVAQPAALAPAADSTSSPAAEAQARVVAAAGAASNVDTAVQPSLVGNIDQLTQAPSSQDPAAAAAAPAQPLASLAAGQVSRNPAAVAAAADASPSPAAAAATPPPSSPAAAAAAAAVPPALAALGIQQPIYVFHQRALEAAADAAHSSSAMDVDPPDEFFDLTVDDLARMQQQANAKKKQEAVFRTRAARDAEEARAAAALGPVRVRLHWPDGTLIQAEFKATEPLSAVQDLVRKCSATQYAPALYLYTTPPKTVLKDFAASLYGLKLVPAAHIYAGIDDNKVASGAAAAGSGSAIAGGAEAQATTGGFVSSSSNTSSTYLRPEVQALMQDHVPEQIQQQQTEVEADRDGTGSNAAAAADAQRALRAAAAASRAEARGDDAAGGNKVPKWLKVGKK